MGQNVQDCGTIGFSVELRNCSSVQFGGCNRKGIIGSHPSASQRFMDADRWVFTNARGFMKYDDDDDNDEDDVTSLNTVSLRLELSLAFPPPLPRVFLHYRWVTPVPKPLS